MGKIEMEDLISPFVEESFQALNPKFGIKMRGFATVGDTKTAPGFSFFRYKLQRGEPHYHVQCVENLPHTTDNRCSSR